MDSGHHWTKALCVMDSGRQALRFGIPGAVLMGSALMSYVLVRWLSGEDLSVVLAPLESGPGSLVAIVGSIPLGWFVYQIYFLMYRPWLMFGWLIRRDRGLEVLAHLSPHQQKTVQAVFGGLQSFRPEYDLGLEGSNRGLFPVLRLSAPERPEGRRRSSPEVRRDYARNWRRHWEIVQSLLIFAEAHGGAALAAEQRHLSDVYHGTGCARYALYGGTFAGTGAALLQLLRRHDLRLASALGAAGILLLAALLGAYALHHVRRQAWKRTVAVVGYGLRMHLGDNPAALEGVAAQLELGRPAIGGSASGGGADGVVAAVVDR
jgi:hypothetical protein